MIEVAMQLHRLDAAPPRFPPPYAVRPYRQGDESDWYSIQHSTGVYGSLDPDLFRSTFTYADLRQRQLYVLHHDEPVATGTAWVGPPLRSEEWGRVHWVAVHPSHQRRGLAVNLMRQLMGIFRTLGCSGVYLTTGSENAPAICLYRLLGFQPWVRSTEEKQFWNAQRRA